MKLIFKLIFAPFLAALCFVGCKSSVPKSEDPNQITAFTEALIIDGSGTQPIPRGVLIIQSGKIVAVGPMEETKIPKGAKVISLKGQSIMPALIANHSHVGSVDGMNVGVKNYTKDNVIKQLKQYQAYGVTTVTALGVNTDLFYELRRELHQGTLPGADLYGADHGIGAMNAAPPLPKEFSGPAVQRVANASDARKAVQEMKARQTDLVKIWYDDFLGTLPKMTPAVYKAVIDESHKNNLRVAAHVYYLKDAKNVLKAGADILAHGVRDESVDAEFITLMKKNNIGYVATLGVDESFYVFGDHPEWVQDPFFAASLSPQLAEEIKNASKMKSLLSNPTTDTRRKAVKVGQANLKKLHDAGVLIGFGTDSGANPWRIPGFAEHRELELMVQAGLSPLQALKAATSNAAEILNLDDRGLLAKDLRADFIILAQNPAEDIRNTRTIKSVWQNGQKVADGF